MGFAILWVMYFHIPIPAKFIVTDVGWFIHRIGFYGVDIFLFLSGLGVYFSLMKRPNVLRFYKARLVRILPAYVIVVCVSYCLLRLDKASALDFSITYPALVIGRITLILIGIFRLSLPFT